MPHDGYKMTELGELPDEWEIVKLSDERLIQKMKAGGTPLSSLENYYKNGSIPFVKIEDMTRSGKYLFKTEFKITHEGLKNCSAWLVPKDSIIYSMYASFGEAAINKIPVATNQAIIAIIPWSAADVEYLYYALWNLKPSLHKYLRETTQKNLNAEVVKNLYLSLPPSSERHRIAEILSTVDETIEHTEALIEKYRNIKKGLMADLLTRGIDEEGRIRSEGTHRFKDSSLGEIPEEWEVKKVDDILILKGGSTPSTINDKYWNGKIPWVVPTDVTKLKSKFINNTERKITKDGLLNCSATLLPKGSILLTSRATIGFLAINEVEMATNQGFINILPSKEVSNIFLYYFLDYIKTKFVLQASGSTFLELSKNSFRKFCIPYPTLPEQHRIAEILTAADERIEKEEAYREKLQQIKKGLMQDLLTGRVRVNKYIGGKYNV